MEDKTTTFTKFQRILVEILGVEPEKVTLEADIRLHLGADSLDIVEICMAAEDEFNIEIYDETMDGADTVQDCISVVNEAIKAR